MRLRGTGFGKLDGDAAEEIGGRREEAAAAVRGAIVKIGKGVRRGNGGGIGIGRLIWEAFQSWPRRRRRICAVGLEAIECAMGEQIDLACGRGRKGDVAVQVDVTGEGGGARVGGAKLVSVAKGCMLSSSSLSHGW